MNQNLLHINIVEAGYGADTKILQDVNFSINRGEIVGLIGPNGAGKSTTIKSILGLLEHCNGKIDFINNHTYSYIPERPVFYDELTLWEHLDLAATVLSISDNEFKARAEALINRFHMENVIHKLPSSFSKGMQQKVMLITAFLLSPDIYIIDEPFVGLDPMAMKDFLTLVNDEKSRGAGVLMSTHVLDTAEKVCDRFLLVADGHLKAQGTLNEIQDQANLQNGTLLDCFHAILAGGKNERI
ncbi:ABC transporter ATP-binding protein [Ferdinandcohnia quinoae]|uniref:ABC transporter ATP-binding protein n=1 Tax=Fredinandcohnia quinoae TaxID=2918902 RepID=A0AAW5DXI2_9BACI|nr:ABC transporter ATP-binding protein [Fredinandcohnia sp. SECRCQ15]MCH1625366.1 ABC transporter ATP-binding protein [Fredinandcohnia sp. SECRCQ15]